MILREAIDMIRPAIATTGGTWADFGAGAGLFTRALAAVLGPEATILAVDSDARALASLRSIALNGAVSGAQVVPIEGDLRHLELVSDLDGLQLSGALFSNAIHFVPDAAGVLLQAARMLSVGGRIVVVEYDDRPASRWVPYPLSVERLRIHAAQSSLTVPRVVGERRSSYGGRMYCAVMERLAPHRAGY